MRDKDGKNSAIQKLAPSPRSRRRAIGLIGLSLMMPLAACGQAVRKEIWLNVVMNSYVDRIHTNIFFNDTTLGVTAKFGTTGTIVGVRIPFGVQTLRWELDGPRGTPRIGEAVTAKGPLVISPEQMPRGTRYLGIHLYPDDTVEFTFAEGIPELTARGQKILADRKK
ncbi:hypothetical protein GCN78_13115 [Janthinobacterium rivuli]|uniref:hypothetical protein n=1 Tax=Janthinobacterium sp. FT68W TaxID=2654255 RepID=UPI0012641EC2|nr:hypothetical protein [Janthinobacterium sp. FT68W]KAB8051080.1 hypothetical protein GCN78_13115 [Janthinobacterium sp. FT68W]